MPGENLQGVLLGGLLVLCRLLGMFAFIPLGMLRTGPDMARIALALITAVDLMPLWPSIAPNQTPGSLAVLVLADASLGLTVGLLVAFTLESFSFAAQLLALQAGYAYASTIDPTNQTDSGILPVLVNTVTGLVFVTIGLDRELLRVFARSLDRFPPGQFMVTGPVADVVRHFGAEIFQTGLSLALPVVAGLFLTDLVLAVLSRAQSNLQLLSLAFPVKMLLALFTLAVSAAMIPSLCTREMNRWEQGIGALWK